MRTLNKEKLTKEEFNEFNFETGFRIYADKQDAVPLNQLSSFLKNVAEL